MRKLQVPRANRQIYEYLYCLETGLRELIISRLSTKFGQRWYLTRLPADVLAKYEQGRGLDLKNKWTNIVPLHPLYYIDFPDLRKIIVQRQNWNEVFKRVFAREDLLSAVLSELDPIRNKIAHNRKATQSDLQIMRTTYAKISTLVGDDVFQTLSGKCTHQLDILELLKRLRSVAESMLKDCVNCNPIDDLEPWESISKSWWFDESYIGRSLKAIREFFELMETYRSLPRRRGTGHAIESWVSSHEVVVRFREASDEFAKLFP